MRLCLCVILAVSAATSVAGQPPETNQQPQTQLKASVENGTTELHNRSSGLSLQATPATISISHQGHPVLVYNCQSPPVPAGIDPVYHRSGFLHPVTSPQGRTVTAAFPADHPHQHGVFTAWVRTTWDDRQIDFWNLAGGTGRVLHHRVVSTFCDDQSAGFEVELLHRATREPAVDVLQERWQVTVYPTDGSYYCFDLQTRQSALTDTPLTVNKYHYGGVALRGPTRWVSPADPDNAEGSESRDAAWFLNDLGSDRINGNHQKSRWVTLAGRIQDQPVSVAVLSHPENFRAPQMARLHPSKPYFCFAPCVEDQFVIDGQHPYQARYRYLITDAEPDPEWIDQQWQQWSE